MRTASYLVLSLVLLPFAQLNAYADDTVVLGSAASLAVLGASAVTNTSTTTINNGNVGSYPTDSLTGTALCPGANCLAFPTGGGVVTATSANQTDLANAITGLSALPSYSLSSSSFTAGIITLTPGVYSTGTTFDLTGGDTLTLDAEGKNVDFIFLIGSALTVGVGSTVKLINAGSNDGVYWVEEGTGGSATLDTGSTFVGNILANVSITLDQGVTINCGSALAHTGAVTMNNDTITTGCNGRPYISGTTVVGASGRGTMPVSTPEPGTLALLGYGFAGLLGMAGMTRAKAWTRLA